MSAEEDVCGEPFKNPPRSPDETLRSIGPAFEKLCQKQGEPPVANKDSCQKQEQTEQKCCPTCGQKEGGGGSGICKFPEPDLGKCLIKINWEEFEKPKKAEECLPKEVEVKKVDECEKKKKDGKIPDKMCQKFLKFANGIPDPEPKEDMYDPAKREQVYENIMSCIEPTKEDEVEDEELAESEQWQECKLNILDPSTAGNKSDRFRCSTADEFVCPPMPNNVPYLCAPVWLQKANDITVPAYPAPPGVKIKPIIQGIRTNRERNPRCLTCGAKRKPLPSKITEKTCPAIRKQCPVKVVEVPSDGVLGQLCQQVKSVTSKVQGFFK